MTPIYIAALVLNFATYLLLAFFGLWLYRRVKLPSLPWLGVYLLLNFTPLATANAWLLDRILQNQNPSLSTLGMMPTVSSFTQWMAWRNLVGAAGGMIIVVLLLADIAFLALKAGVELDNKPVRRLLVARAYTSILGFAAACFALMGHLILLRLYTR